MQIFTRSRLLLAFSFLALGGCATQSGSTSESASGADIVVRASGISNWTVACRAEQSDGDSIALDMRGRSGGNSNVLILEDVASGVCSYAAGDAPLRITLPESDSACPFANQNQGLCITEFRAGASGEFPLAAASTG